MKCSSRSGDSCKTKEDRNNGMDHRVLHEVGTCYVPETRKQFWLYAVPQKDSVV